MVTQNAPVPRFTGSGLFFVKSQSSCRRGLEHGGKYFGERIRPRQSYADPSYGLADKGTHFEQLVRNMGSKIWGQNPPLDI